MAEIKLTLKIADDGTPTIQKVSRGLKQMEQDAKSSTGGMSTVVASLKQQYINLSSAVHDFATVARAGFALIEQAAAFEESLGRVRSQMDGMSMSTKQLVQGIKEVTAGQISMKDALELSSRALTVGMDPSAIINLMGYAEQLADRFGISLPQAADKVISSLEKINEGAFKEAGLYLDLDQKLAVYAKTVGKTSSELTDFEKRQVAVAAATQAFAKALATAGPQLVTANDRIGAMKARFEDIKLQAGLALERIVLFASGLLNVTAAASAMSFGLANAFGIGDQARALLQQGIVDMKLAMASLKDVVDPLSAGMKQLTEEEIRAADAARQLAEFTKFADEREQALRSEMERNTKAADDQANMMLRKAEAVKTATSAVNDFTDAEKGAAAAQGAVIGGGGGGGVGFIPQGDLQFASGLDPKLSGMSPEDALMAVDREMGVLQNRLKPEMWVGTFGAYRTMTEGQKALTQLMSTRSQLETEIRGKGMGGNVNSNVNVTINGASLVDQGSINAFVRDAILPAMRQTSLMTGA